MISRTPAPCRRLPSQRRALTLVELTAALAITTVLLAGMTSAVLIATHALPGASDSTDVRIGLLEALDDLTADLMYAESVPVLTTGDIEFTVADRNHGAAGSETIRYSWSGSIGDSLDRTYNGGNRSSVALNVQTFAVTPTTALDANPSSIVVLMIVNDENAPNADEQAMLTQLQTWGFSVRLMSDDRLYTDILTESQSVDVVYYPAGISISVFVPPPDPPVGAVVENCTANLSLGIAWDCWPTTYQVMLVADNTHAITTGFTSGSTIPVLTGAERTKEMLTLTPDAQILGTTPPGRPVLAVIEPGDRLIDGRTALARRVRLPWAGTLADPVPLSTITTEGKTVLRRSLISASASVVVTKVRVRLVSGAAGTSVERDIPLLNRPRFIQ